MTYTAPTLCLGCIHFNRRPRSDQRKTCAAFPEGIPDKFLFAGAIHDEPEGDEELLYTPYPEGDRSAEVMQKFVEFWEIVDDDRR